MPTSLFETEDLLKKVLADKYKRQQGLQTQRDEAMLARQVLADKGETERANIRDSGTTARERLAIAGRERLQGRTQEFVRPQRDEQIASSALERQGTQRDLDERSKTFPLKLDMLEKAGLQADYSNFQEKLGDLREFGTVKQVSPYTKKPDPLAIQLMSPTRSNVTPRKRRLFNPFDSGYIGP